MARTLLLNPAWSGLPIEVEHINLLGPGCLATDSETLYNEDWAEIMRGNEAGVGVGCVFVLSSTSSILC